MQYSELVVVLLFTIKIIEIFEYLDNQPIKITTRFSGSSEVTRWH